MNAVFCAIFIISAAVLAFTAPQEFLTSLLSGARTSLNTALTLFCVYAVWMGLAAVAEECGITKKAAKALRPMCFKIFKSKNEEALNAAAMNLTCDLLGAGASTPFAVKAIKEFEKEGNAYAQKLLFIINCAGFQLIPSTVIALRAGMGSTAAADIFLPSLICSCATLMVSVTLYIVSEKISSRRTRAKHGRSTATYNVKTGHVAKIKTAKNEGAAWR